MNSIDAETIRLSISSCAATLHARATEAAKIKRNTKPQTYTFKDDRFGVVRVGWRIRFLAKQKHGGGQRVESHR
jgi:hypothetical protein